MLVQKAAMNWNKFTTQWAIFSVVCQTTLFFTFLIQPARRKGHPTVKSARTTREKCAAKMFMKRETSQAFNFVDICAARQKIEMWKFSVCQTLLRYPSPCWRSWRLVARANVTSKVLIAWDFMLAFAPSSWWLVINAVDFCRFCSTLCVLHIIFNVPS